MVGPAILYPRAAESFHRTLVQSMNQLIINLTFFEEETKIRIYLFGHALEILINVCRLDGYLIRVTVMAHLKHLKTFLICSRIL